MTTWDVLPGLKHWCWKEHPGGRAWSVPGIPMGMDTNAADPHGVMHCLLALGNSSCCP